MDNFTHKLSILVPVYNRETIIENTINSVLKQPYPDYEIICVDNNSTDNTYGVLQRIAANEKRLRIYKNDANLGPVANWKICLDHAGGEYIHWLWSDDWVEENFYTDAFNLIDKDQTQIVSSWTYRYNGKCKNLSWRNSNKKIPGITASKKILMLKNELPLSPAAYIISAKLVRKNFFENIPALLNFNPVKSGVGVDSLIVAGSCLDQNQISILQKPSVNFRVHDNISSNLSKDGSLRIMYLISHMWFINDKNVPLSILNILPLILKYIYYFKLLIFNNKVGLYFLGFLKKLKINKLIDLKDLRYLSKKADFSTRAVNE